MAEPSLDGTTTADGPAVTQLPAPENVPAPAPSFADMARDAAEYARSVASLAASEVALAKANFGRLIVVGLLLPAIAFAIVMAIDLFLMAAIFSIAHSWLIGATIVLLLNFFLLFVALLYLRRWWRSLSLPLTRAAVIRFVRGLQQ